MKIVYKILVFTFLVNLSAGLLTSPEISGWNVDFHTNSLQELNNSVSLFAQDPNFKENSSSTLNMDNENNLFDNIFGKGIFGWYHKLMDFINQYLYGIIAIIISILPLDTASASLINTTLHLGLTLIYGFALISFTTGKIFTEED